MRKKPLYTLGLLIVLVFSVYFFTRTCTISGSLFRMKSCECTGYEVVIEKPTVPGSELITRCIGLSKKTESYDGNDLEYIDGRLQMKSR